MKYILTNFLIFCGRLSLLKDDLPVEADPGCFQKAKQRKQQQINQKQAKWRVNTLWTPVEFLTFQFEQFPEERKLSCFNTFIINVEIH